MTMVPKVGVVVLNYNGNDVLYNCLESLSSCNYGRLEIVIVDNASGDRSFEKAKKKFSGMKFLQNENNLGFSKGNNVGIVYALENKCDYVLLLNNDTKVENHFLHELIRIGEKFPEIGILSPLIFKGEGERVWFSGGNVDWLRMKTKHRTDQIMGDFRQSNFITGCAMLVKKEVFEKIGMIDEDYFLYWEDADFCFRTRQAGFKTVVVQKSRITHFEISEKTSKNKLYWLVFSGLLFFKKNSPSFFKPWFRLYISLRKTKNWLERKSGNNEFAQIVHKAYKDFENVS
jgi:GT2 family glycosyltransferase